MLDVITIAELWKTHFDGELPSHLFFGQWKKYDRSDLDTAFRISANWAARLISRGENPTALDVSKYASCVVRNLWKDRIALEMLQQRQEPQP